MLIKLEDTSIHNIMRFIYAIDEIIIKSLEQSNTGLGFIELLEILKNSYPKITKRVLSRHLNLLERLGIIERDQFRPGIKRNSWLSKNTKWMLILGWDISAKYKRDDEGRYSYFTDTIPQTGSKNKSRIERNKKVCMLLMSLAVIGSTRLDPVVGEIVRGDIYLDNKPRRLSVMPGVSVSDFFLKYRDISNAQIFSNIHFHKKSEVEWYLIN